MSSATSTKAPADHSGAPDQSLQPWQFFVLAALACATAVTFLIRAQGLTPVLLLTVLMGTAALVGIAALRTIRPLVSGEDDRTQMIGERTRSALEREKMLALRAIKDLEFDRAMGKIAEDDFRDMTARLRARAARLIRQLDAGGGYRTQIERELAKRLGTKGEAVSAKPAAAPQVQQSIDAGPAAVDVAAPRACTTCSTVNDADARFCKECGARL
jgi:hypothetical protein